MSDTVRAFLTDGQPTGILIAEHGNWTGRVIVAPRARIEQLGARGEANRTGVLMLIDPGRDDAAWCTYIRGTANVLKSLLRHSRLDGDHLWERGGYRQQVVGGTGQTYGEWKGAVGSGTATPEPQADA